MTTNDFPKREHDIALRQSLGWTSERIADDLCIAKKTVDNTKARMFKKYGWACCSDMVRDFILSLDQPKEYLMNARKMLGVGLLVLVSYTSFNSTINPERVMRRSVRTSRMRKSNFKTVYRHG